MSANCLPPASFGIRAATTAWKTPPSSLFNEDDFDECDPEPTPIREFLHLGSYRHALGYCARTLEWKRVRNKTAILERERKKRLGKYKYILNAAIECDCLFPKKIEYLHLNLVDDVDANIRQHFDKCIDFIDRAKREKQIVLVHCFQGVSRSATLVVAYLMRNEGMSRERAVAEVRSLRPMIKPNPTFFRTLGEYEEELGVGREAPSELSDQSREKYPSP